VETPKKWGKITFKKNIKQNNHTPSHPPFKENEKIQTNL
jgi:hypothetical protein